MADSKPSPQGIDTDPMTCDHCGETIYIYDWGEDIECCHCGEIANP